MHLHDLLPTQFEYPYDASVADSGFPWLSPSYAISHGDGVTAYLPDVNAIISNVIRIFPNNPLLGSRMAAIVGWYVDMFPYVSEDAFASGGLGNTGELVELLQLRRAPDWSRGPNWLLWLDLDTVLANGMIPAIDLILSQQPIMTTQGATSKKDGRSLRRLLIKLIKRHPNRSVGLLRALASITPWGYRYANEIYVSTTEPDLMKIISALRVVSEEECEASEFAAELLGLWGDELDSLFDLVGTPTAPSGQTIRLFKALYDRMPRRHLPAPTRMQRVLVNQLESRPVGLGDPKIWAACKLPESLLLLLTR